jgi:uncharacterized membrane protein SpoIIM required for sporulation
MNSEIFIKTHQKAWDRLNLILDQINKKGPQGLSKEDLKALGTLFRQATAHLAYAQINYPDHEVTNYLNNLVVKAHGHIYKQETLGIRPVWNFFSRGFPRLVSEQWRFISAAGLVLILGLIAGYLLHFYQPSLDGLVIPDNLKKTMSGNLGHGQLGADWSLSIRPAMAALIMINNIQVGFFAFALGFTGGVGTILVLFKNGLMVGVLGAIFSSQGFTLDFWSLILPHGVLEFIAIFICGGAGLILAQALVKPGDYKRRDALVCQGRIAIKLVIGTIPLFIIAALIEGFITPSQLPNYFKLGFAACSLVMFYFYIYLGSRSSTPVRR